MGFQHPVAVYQSRNIPGNRQGADTGSTLPDKGPQILHVGPFPLIGDIAQIIGRFPDCLILFPENLIVRQVTNQPGVFASNINNLLYLRAGKIFPVFILHQLLYRTISRSFAVSLHNLRTGNHVLVLFIVQSQKLQPRRTIQAEPDGPFVKILNPQPVPNGSKVIVTGHLQCIHNIHPAMPVFAPAGWRCRPKPISVQYGLLYGNLPFHESRRAYQHFEHGARLHAALKSKGKQWIGRILCQIAVLLCFDPPGKIIQIIRVWAVGRAGHGKNLPGIGIQYNSGSVVGKGSLVVPIVGLDPLPHLTQLFL